MTLQFYQDAGIVFPVQTGNMSAMRLIDRTGDRYERLVVLERMPNRSAKDTNARWLCRCDCGSPVVAYGQDLERGKVKSCGCLNRQRIMQHGMSQLPVYAVWQAMLQRCENPKSQSYENYGGRGIEVCQRWHRFGNFIADMGHPPPGSSLDRIDVNGDYCKENCRWASVVKQANNKRNNRIIEFNGEKRTIGEWATLLGVEWTILRNRLDYYGWTVERALATAIKGATLYEFRGQKKTLLDWAAESGIPLETLRSRVSKLGWSLERTLTTPAGSRKGSN